MKWKTWVAVLATCGVMLSCKVSQRGIVQDRDKDSALSGHTVRSDVEGLRALIKLPAEPKSVRWQTERQRGASDFSLTAVLHYAPDVLDAVVIRSAPYDVQPRVDVRAELAQALFLTSVQQDGGAGQMVRLRGTAVQPNLFVNSEKSSLIHGRALVMKDAGLVFLSLFTM